MQKMTSEDDKDDSVSCCAEDDKQNDEVSSVMANCGTSSSSRASSPSFLPPSIQMSVCLLSGRELIKADIYTGSTVREIKLLLLKNNVNIHGLELVINDRVLEDKDRIVESNGFYDGIRLEAFMMSTGTGAQFCMLCEMWLRDPTQYEDHKIGKRHQTKMRRLRRREGTPWPPDNIQTVVD